MYYVMYGCINVSDYIQMYVKLSWEKYIYKKAVNFT
jgi:hypothetical protein